MTKENTCIAGEVKPLLLKRVRQEVVCPYCNSPILLHRTTWQRVKCPSCRRYVSR